MAYLAVWLERNKVNGYACIIDQNQVFKHLSKSDSKSVRVSVEEIRFLLQTTYKLKVFLQVLVASIEFEGSVLSDIRQMAPDGRQAVFKKVFQNLRKTAGK